MGPGEHGARLGRSRADGEIRYLARLPSLSFTVTGAGERLGRLELSRVPVKESQ